MLETLAQSSNAAAKSLRVRSALNPMLWLTAITTPTCLAGAFFLRGIAGIPILLITLSAVPVLFTCIGFAYFAWRNPEKLQSEDYQLRHETLQLLQSKGGHIRIDPTSLAAITNPIAPALSSGPEGEK